MRFNRHSGIQWTTAYLTGARTKNASMSIASGCNSIAVTHILQSMRHSTHRNAK